MSHPPPRALPRWYLIALGVVLGVGLAAVVIVAIADPTEEILTGLATAVIPPAVFGAVAAARYVKRRRAGRSGRG